MARASYNGCVVKFRILAALWLPLCLGAAVPTLPLAEIKPGMRGVGRTVFQGSEPEEFQAEILGVLENVGPRQSIILARLSGGPLERTGVMQGMSGSPVYIGGKLIGAVALTFQFSKEPIAGIRPIGEMLEVDREPAVRMASQQAAPAQGGTPRLVEIATPVSFNGFTRSTLDRFTPKLRELGFDPVQGVSSGASSTMTFGDPALLRPGSMISVQLLAGDMSVGAEGTITAIDGKNIYGFGHKFLSAGPTDLPFARAEVLALLPNVATSFKISAAREWMGSITQDRSVGIAGVVGEKGGPRAVHHQRCGPGIEKAASNALQHADGERSDAGSAAGADGRLFGDRGNGEDAGDGRFQDERHDRL